MTSPLRIPRLPADQPDPFGFAALREHAIDRAQQASGELWTDFNLHDPGVTLLESLCYALTEDVYAARREVVDLLRLDAAAPPTAWADLGLFEREALIPARPTTEDDWRLWMGSQLPQVRNLHLRARCDLPVAGLWTLEFLSAPGDALHAVQARRAALQAFWSRRGLGEDLLEPPKELQPQRVRLVLHIELDGGREPVQTLLDVLAQADRIISGRAVEGDAARAEAAPGDWADGPLGRAPTASEEARRDAQSTPLFESDLARSLAEVEGVAAIDELRLCVDGDRDGDGDGHGTPGSGPSRVGLSRSSDSHALLLAWPEGEGDLRDWRIHQQGVPLQLPMFELLRLLREARRAGGCAPVPLPGPTQAAPAEPYPPTPVERPALASTALPPLYRSFELEQRRVQPGLGAQWTGWLALLEQPLLQAVAQRQHLRDLYDLASVDTRSSWTSLPLEEELPGIDSLLLPPEGERAGRSRRGADARGRPELHDGLDEDRMSRRQRALDFQLAMHGEQVDHTPLQGIADWDPPQTRPLRSLRAKQRFVRRLVPLGLGHGVGADYSRRLLEEADATPALVERLALKLGMARWHCRPLTRGLALLAPRGDDDIGWWQRDLPAEGSLPILAGYPLVSPSRWDSLAGRVRRLRERLARSELRGLDVPRLTLTAAAIRAASASQRFHYDAGRTELLLADEAGQRAWIVGRGLTAEQAASLALEMRELACLVQGDGDGIHLVETLLLRPQGEASAEAMQAFKARTAGLPDLLLVFAGWTTRGRDLHYQELAQHLAVAEVPLHLRCSLLWLDEGPIVRFETLWTRWLDERHTWCNALLEGHRVDPQPLDEASQRLLGFFLEAVPPAVAGGPP